MLNKEEIEKAKEELNNYIIIINKTKDTENEWHGYYNNELHELKRDIETLLQYIDQLEQENNKQNKMIDLMAGSINSYDSQLDICYFKDREHVKQHYEEYLEKYFEKKVEEK